MSCFIFRRAFLSSAVLLFVFISGIAVVPFSAQAQITLSGTGVSGNPKMLFKGVSGNAELNRKVKNVLWACGWFDLTNSAKEAEYVISGSMQGSSVILKVCNGAEVEMFSVVSQGSSDTAIYTAVDRILNKLFGIEGICRSRIAFAAETGKSRKELYMCDIDGSNIRKITSNGSLSIEPSWHPSGRVILFNQFLTSSSPLVEYDMSRNRSRVLSAQRGINSGRVSHDGRRLALVVTAGNQVDLFVRNYEGGNLIRLTNDRANEASPTWSPDDSKICYVSDRTGRPKLYIISSRGGKPERVPGTSGSECVAPCWGRDNKLAYTAKVGSYVLKVIDLNKVMGYSSPMKDSSNSYIADSAPVAGESPSWAPDNRHVAVSGGGVIKIVDTRTGRSRILVRGASRCSGASWSPLFR